ncbi:GNAT family N-acetyltransferase [Burkholderia dolosa]|uniref:GNAT family N-acetyltransferase n=1 Tax=Burkholderia dolosa TaxID=152500 RepID=UPI0028F444D6|nr:GNAT family N-acetyltransferase [Burkholderia dolosa]
MAKAITTRRSCSTATIAAAGSRECWTMRGWSRRPLGTGRDKQQLKFLHVSRDWRGRGLCESLCRAAGPHARSRGAEHLYCTPATQSQRTTDFYLRPVLRSANPPARPGA